MTDLQARYFNHPGHRFPSATLLDPTLSQHQELAALTAALHLSPGSRLIDFGCGNGRISLHFLKLGYHVLAIDISRQSLAALERLYRQVRQPSWGHLTTASLLPPIPTVDGIVGADILHHVDMTTLVPRLFQALNPGGHAAFSEPNAWHLPWYAYYAAHRIPWEIEQNIRYCTLPHLTRQFLQAGFTHLSVAGHGLLPTPLFNRFPQLNSGNLLLGNIPLLKHLAFRFILSALKP